MEVLTGATHYLTVPFGVPGLQLPDFSVKLFKNGELNQDSIVDVFETSVAGTYTFFFLNDSTDRSYWMLQVAFGGSGYFECWSVRKPVVEAAINEIRAKQGEGGYLAPVNNQTEN